MGKIVGIDLGTTYSAVAYVNELGKAEMIKNRDGDVIMPSVVMIQGDDILVGVNAKRSAPTAPDDVAQFVKRNMGDPAWRFYASDGSEYTAEQVSAMILRRLKEDAEMKLGEPVTDAVITVPAYFDDARRKATMDAGSIAGLNVRRVLNEPTAAALSYGLDTQINGTVLVYDLGGGTFDVTIMRIGDGQFEVLATDGDRNLGGFDWDGEMMQLIIDKIKDDGGPDLSDNDEISAELREKAEGLKINLTQMANGKIFLTANGQNLKTTITREEFEAATAGLLGRTESLVENTLDESGLSWSDINHLLLVGGSTRMPMVPAMMRRLSGMEPDRNIEPDEAVALGAAIQAHLEAAGSAAPGEEHLLPVLAGSDGKPIRVADVTSHGLGVIALNELNRDQNFVIIPRNTKLPAKGSNIFSTVVDNQTTVNVQLTQGDDDDPAYVNIFHTKPIKLPHQHPAGAPMEYLFSYDVDGLLHVEINDLTTGDYIGELEVVRTENLSQEEIDKFRKQLDDKDIN